MSRNQFRALFAALVAFAILSACGVSVDESPRDIDPAKQAILEAPTTLP